MRENKKVPDNEKSNQILNDVLEELHQKEIKRRSRGINETVTSVNNRVRQKHFDFTKRCRDYFG